MQYHIHNHCSSIAILQVTHGDFFSVLYLMAKAVKAISQDLGKPEPFISTIPILGAECTVWINMQSALLEVVFSLKTDENKAIIHEC